MDDRKKRIDDLERDKLETRISLDALLENFGENLYSRTKDMQIEFDDITQYNLYLKEITKTNAAIGKVEEKNRRFKELEETIEFKEKEEKERAKELACIYRRLGKALLENKAYDDFTSLFREQADTLTNKLESLENRIKELENKSGNVFAWIGKSAQGLVLRSFLSKAQESQEQLYYNIGERYSTRDSVSEEEEIDVIRREINELCEISRAALDDLAHLKDEKRLISSSFGIDGTPQKQIQSLKNQITSIKENLRLLYRNFGAQAAGIMDADIAPERKYFIDGIVTAEDGETIGRAVRLNQSLSEYEKAIAKLTASLAIDEENQKIEKYRRSISEKKNKITDLEKAIDDLENGINESQALIEELQKQL